MTTILSGGKPVAGHAVWSWLQLPINLHPPETRLSSRTPAAHSIIADRQPPQTAHTRWKHHLESLESTTTSSHTALRGQTTLHLQFLYLLALLFLLACLLCVRHDLLKKESGCGCGCHVGLCSAHGCSDLHIVQPSPDKFVTPPVRLPVRPRLTPARSPPRWTMANPRHSLQCRHGAWHDH
jgi:hypothetical protein